jgi:hypothetical protein
MLSVKVTIPGAPSALSLQEFTGSHDNFIDGVQFHVNTDFDTPDVWLVFDDGVDGHSAVIDSANIFFMTAEICYPIGRFDDERGQRYLSQFAKLFTMHDIFDERTHFTRPFTQWMMNANHGSSTYWDNLRGRNYFRDVTSFEKPHDLSVICSAKAFTPEHYARLKFVTRLKEDLKDRLHWYGNGINALTLSLALPIRSTTEHLTSTTITTNGCSHRSTSTTTSVHAIKSLSSSIPMSQSEARRISLGQSIWS